MKIFVRSPSSGLKLASSPPVLNSIFHWLPPIFHLWFYFRILSYLHHIVLVCKVVFCCSTCSIGKIFLSSIRKVIYLLKLPSQHLQSRCHFSNVGHQILNPGRWKAIFFVLCYSCCITLWAIEPTNILLLLILNAAKIKLWNRLI